MTIAIRRQVLLSLNQVTKYAELLLTQYIDKVAKVPIVMQQQVPQFQTVLKTVEAPLAQFIGKVEHACDQAEEIIHQKRIPERVGQFDDVPVPQILNEIVEVVKAVKNVPRERISEEIGVQKR